MKNTFLFIVGLCMVFQAFSQKNRSDSTRHLSEVEIIGARERIQIERLPDVNGTYLTAGKKNEVIHLSGINANIAERNPRQIFAKIPGIFV